MDELIHIDDVTRCMLHLIAEPGISGPLNLVAPGNVINRDFHNAMKYYHKPMVDLRVPAIGVKPILGQRAQLVLKGPEVVPEKLTQTGFDFAFPTLEPFWRTCIKTTHFQGFITCMHVNGSQSALIQFGILFPMRKLGEDHSAVAEL